MSAKNNPLSSICPLPDFVHPYVNSWFTGLFYAISLWGVPVEPRIEQCVPLFSRGFRG